MGVVRVLYQGSRGVMALFKKKPVFQIRGCDEKLERGLGELDIETFLDKGNYAFAKIRNVVSVFPEGYKKIEFFTNRGVPHQIFTGNYGESLFFKEVYSQNKAVISAFNDKGEVLLREHMLSKSGAQNMYYNRLDSVIDNWKDITDEVVSALKQDILSKKANINLKNPYLLYVLRSLRKSKVGMLDNGVILADGNYETLVIWGEGNDISMTWFGRKIEDFQVKDIISEVQELLVKNGLD